MVARRRRLLWRHRRRHSGQWRLRCWQRQRPQALRLSDQEREAGQDPRRTGEPDRWTGRRLRKAETLLRAADCRSADGRGGEDVDFVGNLHLSGRATPLLQDGPLSKLAKRDSAQPDFEQVFHKGAETSQRGSRIVLEVGGWRRGHHLQEDHGQAPDEDKAVPDSGLRSSQWHCLRNNTFWVNWHFWLNVSVYFLRNSKKWNFLPCKVFVEITSGQNYSQNIPLKCSPQSFHFTSILVHSLFLNLFRETSCWFLSLSPKVTILGSNLIPPVRKEKQKEKKFQSFRSSYLFKTEIWFWNYFFHYL